MNFLKKILPAFLVVMIGGCASAYKPTPNVLELSGSMTQQEAVVALKSVLIKKASGKGLCAANGIPEGSLIQGRWHLDRDNPMETTDAREISFNAQQHIVNHAVHGEVSTSGSATFTTSTTNYKSFRRAIKYADLESAKIFTEVSMLNMLCSFSTDEVEVRINLATGVGHWISVVVNKEELDRFMAGLIILVPNIKLKIN